MNFDSNNPIGKILDVKLIDDEWLEFEAELFDEKTIDLIELNVLKGVGIGGRIKEFKKVCQTCRTRSIEEDDKFCGNCGYSFIQPIQEIEDFELHDISLVKHPIDSDAKIDFKKKKK